MIMADRLQRNQRKIRLGCCVIVICVMMATFSYVLFEKKADPIARFESGTFTLRGESIFWGKEKISRCFVEERHDGDDYYIDRTNRIYIRENNQYYIDEGDGKKVVLERPEEMAGIVEMFDCKSEISNYRFSNLVQTSEYPAEIPTMTGENVNCVCLEYSLIQECTIPLRLYFLADELYAIRSKNDDRFVFYVESLS